MNFNSVPRRKSTKITNISLGKRSVGKTAPKPKRKVVKVVDPEPQAPKSELKFKSAGVPVISGIQFIPIQKSKQLPFNVTCMWWKGVGKDAVKHYIDKYDRKPVTVFYIESGNSWYVTDKNVSARDVSLEPIVPMWHAQVEAPKKVRRHKPAPPVRYLKAAKTKVGKSTTSGSMDAFLSKRR